MHIELFVLAVAGLAALILAWAFRALPREEWQILAAIPRRKQAEGWVGVNLTYYGALAASGYAIGLAFFLLLCGAVGWPVEMAIGVLASVLGLCVPASKWIARLVEGKKHTFTIGGATFLGFLILPVAVLIAERFFLPALPFGSTVLPGVAAGTIAYVFGEAIGRLACISFGCCYGKPLPDDAPSWMRRLAMRFQGRTKKISYASGLEGVPVIPVQALGSVFLMSLALLSVWLFLHSGFAAALGVALIGSQAWRFGSEFLRADERGGGRLTAYQRMSLGMAVAGGVLCFLPIGSAPFGADLGSGLEALWNPAVILFLQLVWMVVFLFMGWSQVTGSTLSFHVHEDRV